MTPFREMVLVHHCEIVPRLRNPTLGAMFYRQILLIRLECGTVSLGARHLIL